MPPAGVWSIFRLVNVATSDELAEKMDLTPLPSTDATTTVAELRQIVADFVAERDWSQFHSPKNVSMALAIEAAELMEHFQWLTTEASRRIADNPTKLAEVSEEIADVVGYSMALANELGIDLASTIRAKMVKNAQKYPADQFRGRFGRDDPG
jgi:NTP pyrophosphatase (non-canonical NTP hydrolase)